MKLKKFKFKKVKSTNNTAIRIIKKTKYDSKTVLKGNITSRSKLTFYSRYGDMIARWCIFIVAIFFLVALSGRFKSYTLM